MDIYYHVCSFHPIESYSKSFQYLLRLYQTSTSNNAAPSTASSSASWSRGLSDLGSIRAVSTSIEVRPVSFWIKLKLRSCRHSGSVFDWRWHVLTAMSISLISLPHTCLVDPHVYSENLVNSRSFDFSRTWDWVFPPRAYLIQSSAVAYALKHPNQVQQNFPLNITCSRAWAMQMACIKKPVSI